MHYTHALYTVDEVEVHVSSLTVLDFNLEKRSSCQVCVLVCNAYDECLHTSYCN
jgi:hypothetical protein